MIDNAQEWTISGARRQMAEMFRKHLRDAQSWLGKQPNMDVLYVSYNEMLTNAAESIERINALLGGGLDTEKMAGAVDRNLHRQRR